MGSTWRVSGPCCARVPWSLAVSRRPVNSRGGSSPGRTTSAPLKQHRACILDTAIACGQSPDSPVEPNCPLKNAKKTVIFANKILSLAATKENHRKLVSCPNTDSWRHEQQSCLSLPHFEPLGSSAPVSGRFRLLAAGGVRIRGASALLFERGACVLSGGQDTPRVKGAPVSEHRPGYRCAAPASSQPGYRGRRTERRLAETKLPSISSRVSKPSQTK
ncbi:hypothetical protein ACI0FN_01934 [Alcaligenes nematophilus]